MLSVLVAVYNSRPYLCQCLDSLLAQTFKDIEIICIDDASTDGSWDILQQYQTKDRRITLLRNDTNQGASYSRNKGISVSKGEYICYLDSDDWFDNDSLENVMKVFNQDPNIDCVLFRLLKHFPDGTITEHTNLFPPHVNIISGKEACQLAIDWSIHGVFAAKAHLFKEFPYDTSTHYYSDDNTTRILYLHAKAISLSHGNYNYRRYPESATMKLSLHTFDHILANINLKQQLISEGATRDMLIILEVHRLYNLLGAYKKYFFGKSHFTANERDIIRTRISEALHSIDRNLLPKKVKNKFGYYPFKYYTLFRIEMNLFWTLRSIMQRIRRVRTES
ncbi:MAG: glycosyltransferase family 2 protein [Prevotellaceae bacterium]|nr:glycosyltransferase family 2 protein [Candidatus Colivivens equi]